MNTLEHRMLAKTVTRSEPLLVMLTTLCVNQPIGFGTLVYLQQACSSDVLVNSATALATFALLLLPEQ